MKKAQVRVIKVDLDNNEVKLKGVKFNVLDENKNVLETIITNDEGEAITSKYPVRDFEKLTLQETETLQNYKLNTTPQTVKLEANQIKDIIFTGRINTSEYIGKMDFTILTSISEGQPLTILEGYAAHKPAIATDVGNCRGLIYGEDDPYGPSGIVTHIMNVEEIKEAILFLANNPETCKEYGENGYKRLIRRYTIVDMKNTYDGIYTELSKNMTD